MWEWIRLHSNWINTGWVHEAIYWPEFVDDLRAQIAQGQFRDARTWPVLFLDDIGAERDSTGYAAEQLNMILGCRVGRWTIITSNLMLDQLAKIDPRISDRMHREPGNIIVELTTTSYALRNADDALSPHLPNQA